MSKPTTYGSGYDTRYFRPDYFSFELWDGSGAVQIPPFGDRFTFDSREVKQVGIGANVSRQASYSQAGYAYSDTLLHPVRWTVDIIQANADTFEKMRLFFLNVRDGLKVRQVRLSGVLEYSASTFNTTQVNELIADMIVSFDNGQDWLTNVRGRGHQAMTPFHLVFEQTRRLTYPEAPVTGTATTTVTQLIEKPVSFFASST